MKKLKELVAALPPNKIKSVELLDGSGTTQLDELYRMLTDKPELTDDEALAALYPDRLNKNAYYKLKHRLRRRLFNVSFLVDLNKKQLTDRASAYDRCQYLLGLANRLFVLGAKVNAMDAYRKSLRISELYEMTAERITAVSRLLNYAVQQGDHKMFEGYAEELRYLTALLQKETTAQLLWNRIGIRYRKDKSIKPALAEASQRYLRELDAMPLERPSQRLFYFETMIGASRHLARQNHAGATEILEPALERLLTAGVIATDYLFGVGINLTTCHIALRNYTRADELIQLLYRHVPEEHNNGFRTRMVAFVLYVHTGRYDAAANLHAEVIKKRSFKRRPAFARETWIVYGAYLRILRNAGLLASPQEKAKPFRPARYLNRLHILTQDKRGQNISVLISHTVLLLQQHRYDRIIDRFEALVKYRVRYAGTDGNLRADTFLRLLQLTVRTDFNRAATEREGQHLLSLLRDTPEDAMSPYYDQEVIPFSILWEIVRDLLD